MDLIINEKFRALLPPLSEEELLQLERNCLEEGIREQLHTWQNQIVDGHNRFYIAEKHDLPFATHEHHFADEGEAMQWIRDNQLGRRNLSPNMITLYIGQSYEYAKKKKSVGQKRDEDGQFTVTDIVTVTDNTAEKLAEEYGVSEKTVRRAGKVAQVLEEVEPEVRERFKKGEITQKDLVKKAKKLKEVPLEPTPLDHPHLNNLKFHGGLISEAAKLLKQRMDDYENYLHAGQYKAQEFAPRLHTTATRDVIDDVFLSSKSLRRLEICPLCTGKGCEKCHSLGLMEAQDAAAFKKEA
jgi:hypothetical protein